MTVKESIIQMIQEYTYVPASVTEGSNLYADLGFDSLSFITLLTEIEDAYSISFDIAEMQSCLQVDNLITSVGSKIKERDVSID